MLHTITTGEEGRKEKGFFADLPVLQRGASIPRVTLSLSRESCSPAASQQLWARPGIQISRNAFSRAFKEFLTALTSPFLPCSKENNKKERGKN